MRSARIKYTLMYYFLPLVLVMIAGITEVKGQRIYADVETHSGTTLLSEVKNPTWSIVHPPYSDCSTLSTTLGLLNLVEAWQNIKFSGTKPTSNTPITVKFGTTGSSIITVLDAVSLQPSLNGAVVGARYDNSTLLTLLGIGASDAEITLPPQGIAFDGITYKVSSTLGLVVSGRFYYAFFIVAPTSTSKEICSGSSVTLGIDNFQSGYTYNWYTSSIATVPIYSSTNQNFSPAANLTNTTSYYVEAVETSTGTNYYSGRTEVTVTVHPKPSPPNIAAQ